MEKLPLFTSRLSIYEHPRHIPGYTGYCPQQKLRYAETFGNSTASWYHTYYNSTLSNSKERLGRGGDKEIQFPDYYPHEPSLVVGTRSRTHRRWEASPKYHLHNKDDRDEMLNKFKVATEDHREQYKDQTGTKYPMAEFILPKVSYQTTPIWSIQRYESTATRRTVSKNLQVHVASNYYPGKG